MVKWSTILISVCLFGQPSIGSVESLGTLDFFQMRDASSNGRTTRLDLSPLNRFFYSSKSCDNDWQYKGTYVIRNDTLFLTPNNEVPLPTWYHVVAWGDFEILLDARGIKNFINAYNSGEILRYDPLNDARVITTNYLSNIPNELARSVTGNPTLPSPFRNLILEQPITPMVTDINHETFQITLDLGSRANVWVGMKFYSVSDIDVYSFEVTEVTETNCVAQETIFRSKAIFEKAKQKSPENSVQISDRTLNHLSDTGIRVMAKIGIGDRLSSFKSW